MSIVYGEGLKGTTHVDKSCGTEEELVTPLLLAMNYTKVPADARLATLAIRPSEF